MVTVLILIAFFSLLGVSNYFDRKMRNLEERIEELEGKIDEFGQKDDEYIPDPFNVGLG